MVSRSRRVRCRRVVSGRMGPWGTPQSHGQECHHEQYDPGGQQDQGHTHGIPEEVLQRTEELIAKYSHCVNVTAIVLDMPLLIEVGWADRCDRLIFVKCDHRRRGERARRVGLMDGREVKIRENFQISVDKKAELADTIVDNNSDFSTLVRQIQDIFSDIAGSR